MRLQRCLFGVTARIGLALCCDLACASGMQLNSAPRVNGRFHQLVRTNLLHPNDLFLVGWPNPWLERITKSTLSLRASTFQTTKEKQTP